jgi:hypothetical protein
VKFIDDPMPETLAAFASWSQELGFERRTIGLDGLVDTRLLEAAR